MEYLLETDNLTKIYGKQRAAEGISLHVKKGDIYGLIGKNGAGKTTVLKMLGGLSKPTCGSFSLYGCKGRELKKVQSRIGILIEEPGVYMNMPAYENLRMKCLAMGIQDKGMIDEILRIVGLSDVGNKHVKNFSLGMKLVLQVTTEISLPPRSITSPL